MPIFEYISASCGLTFEQLVLSTSKSKDVSCPTSQGQEVTKHISAFASKHPGEGTPSSRLAAGISCSTGSV